MNKRGVMNNKGQLTLFIILAIIIVAVLIFIFYPRIRALISPASVSSSMDACVKREISGAMDKLMLQGGSFEPENTFLYNDKKVEYLCYTNEYYKTCTMQQPLLKQHIEEEIVAYLKPKVDECKSSVANELQSRGYDVSVKPTTLEVNLVPGNIKVIANTHMTARKGDTSEDYDKFIVSKTSSSYEMIMMASSILNWEARYGDSDIAVYMLYYPTIKVEKYKQSDGTKIYIITDKESNEEFIFATRSQAWPAGYSYT